MAKFIELIDYRDVKHFVNIDKIEQVMNVKGNETLICLANDRFIVRNSFEDIVKNINKKGGFPWL
nr:MAG TPA: Flagellar and Swarming motility protein [Bacteriophage sp.]